MTKRKLLLGLFLLLILIIVISVSYNLLWKKPLSEQPKADQYSFAVDYSSAFLEFPNDSILVFCESQKQSSDAKKFIGNIQAGNISYAFRRLWLESKAFLYRMSNQKQANTTELDIDNFQYNLELGKSIGATNIRNGDGIIIGNIIWVNEKNVEFDYIHSPETIAPEVDLLLKSKNVLTLFSACYFDENKQGVGFQAEKGKLINRCFNLHWDGLVIINESEMMVANLEDRKIIRSSNQSLRFNKTGTILTVPFNFNVEKEELTAIQLPLVAFNNQFLIDDKTAPKHLREMRFLCKVASPGSDHDFYLIVNLNSPNYLSKALFSLQKSLNNNNNILLYALLLDMGSNNFLRVYNYGNEINTSFAGLIPIENASNALMLCLKGEYESFILELNNYKQNYENQN